jgi:secondary thiamine-phosphate synthase enzyme
MKTITIQTTSKTEVVNVTDQLGGLVRGVESGLAYFSVPHTTAALVTGEDDEELRADMVRVMQNLLAGLRPFQHRRKNNPNAEAHIFSALAGTSLVLAAEGGRLALGTYQQILLLEMDGPKQRQVHCMIMPVGRCE